MDSFFSAVVFFRGYNETNYCINKHIRFKLPHLTSGMVFNMLLKKTFYLAGVLIIIDVVISENMDLDWDVGSERVNPGSWFGVL